MYYGLVTHLQTDRPKFTSFQLQPDMKGVHELEGLNSRFQSLRYQFFR